MSELILNPIVKNDLIHGFWKERLNTGSAPDAFGARSGRLPFGKNALTHFEEMFVRYLHMRHKLKELGSALEPLKI